VTRRAVVLVKQVPDLRSAPIGVTEDGTIARQQADAIVNPVDLHAVEAAITLADEVVALTMGPPRAEEVLREAIARGADAGVLVCDRALAGSDTWATSNALAAAIEHVGDVDLVVCGTTALDGETGQVGPQVAHRLGLPQATFCEHLEIGPDGLDARRIVEGGYERLHLPLPALVTVAETGFSPRYPTMIGRRQAAQAVVQRLGADDLGLGPDRVGLRASPTKVAHMAPAPVERRARRLVGGDFGLDDLVAALTEVGALAPTDPPAVTPAAAPRADPGGPARGDAAVWVAAEVHDHGLARVSAGLLSHAATLAPELGGGVAAFIAADDPGRGAADAARFGADTVLLATHAELSPYRAAPHARVLADAIHTHRPEAVLFGATTTGRDLAPRVAAMVDAGLAADCTDLSVGPWERRGARYEALLHQIRPAMAGGVLATCVAPDARPQMATVRPGVFAPTPRPREATVIEMPTELTAEDLSVTVLERTVKAGDVHLADADVVIAGGAGCDEGSWHLVEDLAGALGGRVAATRAAVEAGLASRSVQVGQTGTTVRPRLYVACGVSGALQHVVGMRGAGTVLAVNRDPDAFIFEVADFGIVGEVVDVLPDLTAALARART
jgi:electron transfer flavoprotein alpha subunit